MRTLREAANTFRWSTCGETGMDPVDAQAWKKLDAAITEAEAELAGVAIPSAEFRREVQDKFSVVSHRGTSRLQSEVVMQQCENFLVEQFESAMFAEKARADAAEQRETDTNRNLLYAEQREAALVEALRWALLAPYNPEAPTP